MNDQPDNLTVLQREALPMDPPAADIDGNEQALAQAETSDAAAQRAGEAAVDAPKPPRAKKAKATAVTLDSDALLFLSRYIEERLAWGVPALLETLAASNGLILIPDDAAPDAVAISMAGITTAVAATPALAIENWAMDARRALADHIASGVS
jgi:hypothetical protein